MTQPDEFVQTIKLESLSATYLRAANGNRSGSTINGTTSVYNVDDGDKLNSITVSGTTVKSYGYDAAGRTTSVVTSAGTTSLSYDYEDRITGITYPSTVTNSFSYNGLDTRVSKVDSTGTYTYLRDGVDVTDPVLADGAAAYTPAISQNRSGTTTYDLNDYLGSATRQTSTSASTTATRSYDAWGNLLSSTGTPLGPFGFAGACGYQEDGDSGLKLLGHRYVDPSTGRFLTRDPDGDGRNWYAYCDNNPLSGTDEGGLQSPKKHGGRAPIPPWSPKHPPYKSIDGAATAAIAAVMPASMVTGNEVGGGIYRVPGGYRPSPPTAGEPTYMDVTETDGAGLYHTHPNPHAPDTSDNGDQNVADTLGIPVYAGNTYGNIWKNDPRPGHGGGNTIPGPAGTPRIGNGAHKLPHGWR